MRHEVECSVMVRAGNLHGGTLAPERPNTARLTTLTNCITNNRCPMPEVPRSRKSVITELFRESIAGLGKEGRLLTVEYASGVHTPPHRHPGSLFVYVLEGKVVSQMEGSPSREYSQGESWFEAEDCFHVDAGNDSGAPAKILVFYLTEPGRPVLVFEDGTSV
jgi:quercetin dioxygenase-like cupin family protein